MTINQQQLAEFNRWAAAKHGTRQAVRLLRHIHSLAIRALRYGIAPAIAATESRRMLRYERAAVTIASPVLPLLGNL